MGWSTLGDTLWPKCHMRRRSSLNLNLKAQPARVAFCQRYCFFSLSVTFFLVSCREDVEGLNAAWIVIKWLGFGTGAESDWRQITTKRRFSVCRVMIPFVFSFTIVLINLHIYEALFLPTMTRNLLAKSVFTNLWKEEYYVESDQKFQAIHVCI